MKQVNILFTSVGRRVELVRAFKNALEDLAIQGNIIGTDVDPLAPALHRVDTPVLVPPLTSPDYIPCLADLCHRHSVNLVFPLIDRDIPPLAQNRETIEKTGARLGVVSRHAADLTADKWETFRFFQQIQVPTPRSWLPAQIDPEKVEYPLFVKPRSGSGSKDTYRVRNEKELQFFIHYVPDPIIQEFLPGPEITNDVFCSFSGEVWAVVSRQRIEVRWGEVSKGQTVFNPVIMENCMKIATSLRALGPITVQCLMKGDIPCFTEINARFAGGSPLALASGVPFPHWYLQEAAGLPPQIPPLGTYKHPVYLTRFDESLFLSQDEIEEIASHRF